ncbi:hypothetical protein [Streptosporangium sp. NPDC002607]
MKTNPSGNLKATVTASRDGYRRFGFAGDSSPGTVTGTADHVGI